MAMLAVHVDRACRAQMVPFDVAVPMPVISLLQRRKNILLKQLRGVTGLGADSGLADRIDHAPRAIISEAIQLNEMSDEGQVINHRFERGLDEPVRICIERSIEPEQ
jgi:hypothetical protein